MKRLQKISLIIEITEALREKGSWCGETHIQKATYFLQELSQLPLDFYFIMYKHGPFSFDLRDEITAMLGYGIMALKPQPYPYGPSIFPTEVGKEVKIKYPKTIKKYKDNIALAAEIFGNKGAAELEKLATALYVLKEEESENKTLQSMSNRFKELKPHVSLNSAKSALREIREIIDDWQSRKS